jgi:formylglycine-generating enzyme required for sulfatase activity
MVAYFPAGLMISDDMARRTYAVLRSVEQPFSVLCRLAGLAPGRHWRGADLRDVAFGADDLRGFDFSGADLRGAKLAEARNLRAEMFVDTITDHTTTLPDALRAVIWPPARALLRWREPIPGLPEEAWPDMVTLPTGSFLMGAPKNENVRNQDERPQRQVSVSRPFAIGRCAVTFAQWDAAVAAGAKLPNPEAQNWGRGECPVINVSWEDAHAYCVWLNERLGLRPGAYRLPSEAEWEYACRAGTETPFSFGATITTEQANYDGNYTYGRGRKGAYRERTVPVGSLPANGWGLHEMHGNVWEWCEDHYGPYADRPTDTAPLSHGKTSPRVFRGGSWDNGPQDLRSANRNRIAPAYRYYNIGFRLARTLGP